jgi:hypothetical protein
MTSVKANVKQLIPLGGGDMAGKKFGYIDAATKAAQNDTLYVKNAQAVYWACLLDASGNYETNTVSGQTITLTSSVTSTTVSGIVIYR